MNLGASLTTLTIYHFLQTPHFFSFKSGKKVGDVRGANLDGLRVSSSRCFRLSAVIHESSFAFHRSLATRLCYGGIAISLPPPRLDRAFPPLCRHVGESSRRICIVPFTLKAEWKDVGSRAGPKLQSCLHFSSFICPSSLYPPHPSNKCINIYILRTTRHLSVQSFHLTLSMLIRECGMRQWQKC